jgi:hypothetical protein
MRRFSVLATMILFMVSFVAGATLGAGSAAAQVGPGSRVLANGQVLTWSDFYELDQTTVAVVDGVEFVDLYSATGWFSVITTNFPAYGNVLRDLSVQDLQSSVPLRQIDRGDYSNVSYSLDTTIYQGVDIGAFTLVLDQGGYAQLTMVVAPVTTFQYELQIAQKELTIGGGGVFQGVDAVKMQGILTRATGVPLADLNQQSSNTTVIVVPGGGQAQQPAQQQPAQQQPAQQQPAQQQPAQQQPAQQQPAQQQPAQTGGMVSQPTSTVFVGNTEVGWTGSWQQNTSATSASQATFSRTNPTSGAMELVSYGEFSDPSMTSVPGAVDAFANAFFQAAGATGVQQIDGGVLQTGATWKVYRYNLQGNDLATFVMGSQNATGAYVITTVTANTSTLMLTMIDVQAQFSLNRTTSMLAGVDPIMTTIKVLA